MALKNGPQNASSSHAPEQPRDAQRSRPTRAQGWLEDLWYRPPRFAYALLPLGLLYRAVVALRWRLYRAGLLPRTRLPVPVVVIGNITVGGTGKTPLSLWLAQRLAQSGRKPAIVCRSYGASAESPARVHPHDDPAVRGDEAVLLAREAPCPVWSGPNRAQAARALVAAHPEIDVVVCDDGLQHYALRRDVEIAVIDAERGFGNGLPLPAGPLREPLSRLRRLDAIVIHGESGLAGMPTSAPVFGMRLEGRRLRNLADPARTTEASALAGQRIVAVAGIGHPARFHSHLRALGLVFEAHDFPDHHRYAAQDLRFPGADAIVMTEKDAIKCHAFADARMWSLPVSAVASDDLARLVVTRIARAAGRATRARAPAT